MRKSIIISFVLVMLSAITFAQEKPIRIGLKFGVPNIVGLNAEYVTPALNARLAPTMDFSYFSVSAGDASVSMSYFELGGNYYFMNEGKGPYGHLSYGRIGASATVSDPDLGEGKGSFALNRVNLKIGAKWGNGFYFRPEIGYAMMLGDATFKAEYNGTTQEESVPGLLNLGLMFNLGFGIAFGGN